MGNSMEENFELLSNRVIDSMAHTDLDKITKELKKIDKPTIFTGSGGSRVVSDFGSKVLREKNKILTANYFPRDFKYRGTNGFKNVFACSYSGCNKGVSEAFDNRLKKYLLSSEESGYKHIHELTYGNTIPKENSFISLASTLVPISILYYYYLDKDCLPMIDELVVKQQDVDFRSVAPCYEIFSGYDTSTTAKYLESTFAESGIGIPVVHDKYDYCHGRSNLAANFSNIAIYLNKDTQLDRYILSEIYKHYREVIVISGGYKDPIRSEYHMLLQAIYLTKAIVEKKGIDLSDIKSTQLNRKLYKYQGDL